nr:pyridoxal 5'-phosphate synthase glutaminase subunit PdxT [Agilicoccus flavus]
MTPAGPGRVGPAADGEPVRIGVLAVQGDVREHAQALSALGVTWVRVRRPGELADLDGLILPGGESTVQDKLTRALGLRDPLRAAISDGLPVYGSCAGMIMLASTVLDGEADQQTLGGMDVTVRRNAFGRQVDSFETDLRFPALTEPERPIRAVFIRAPWIEAVGPGVEVLARVPERPQGSDAGVSPAAGRVVAARQGNLFATSFHPEVTGDLRVHRYFVDLVRAARERVA